MPALFGLTLFGLGPYRHNRTMSCICMYMKSQATPKLRNVLLLDMRTNQHNDCLDLLINTLLVYFESCGIVDVCTVITCRGDLYANQSERLR